MADEDQVQYEYNYFAPTISGRLLKKDIDFKIRRFHMKICPKDPNHYELEKIYDIEYLKEHTVKSIINLGYASKELSLERKISDETGKDLYLCSKNENSLFAAYILYKDLVELIKQLDPNLQDDEVRENWNLLFFCQHTFCCSIPEKKVKWDSSYFSFTPFKEKIIKEFRANVFTKDFAEKFFDQENPQPGESNEDLYGKYLGLLKDILDLFNEPNFNIQDEEITFNYDNPIYNPILMIMEIIKNFQFQDQSQSHDNEAVRLRNLDEWKFQFGIEICLEYLRRLKELLYNRDQFLSQLKSYLMKLKESLYYYLLLIKPDIEDTSPLNLTDKESKDSEKKLTSSSATINKYYVLRRGREGYPSQIKISTLMALEQKENTTRKEKLQAFFDKYLKFKTIQAYPFLINVSESNHIEIRSPDPTIRMLNKDTVIHVKKNEKDFIESFEVRNPLEFFDVKYQGSQEDEEGSYDIHHYLINPRRDTIQHEFLNKNGEKEIIEIPISNEFLISETFQVKGVTKIAYLIIMFLLIASTFFFAGVGLNILALKLEGEIDVWLDLVRVLTTIVSFSGLSLSVIALIVSFRRDHLLVLSHTDQIRKMIIFLVCLSIYILFCVYILVSIYWKTISLFIIVSSIIFVAFWKLVK